MDPLTLSRIFRWIHILAAGAWLGEVVVVVFILVPVVVRLERERRGWFLATIFPRIFRTVTVGVPQDTVPNCTVSAISKILRRVVLANPRVKEQSYCGKSACQRARKAAWQAQRLSIDPAYQDNQQRGRTRWRRH